MKKHIYQGKIWTGESGENYEALLVGYNSKPLADRIDDEVGTRTQVNIRYWITEEEREKNELIENEVLKNAGSLDARYYDRYSDLTGYLWTEEHLNIRGHNLLKELYSHKEKFLYLEIDEP